MHDYVEPSAVGLWLLRQLPSENNLTATDAK